MAEKLKIFVCTKGKKCTKKGADDVCRAFEQAIAELGADNITVKETKCLDLCKKGPVAMVMPDKVRYGRLDEDDARKIVRAHMQGETVEKLTIKKK